MRRELARKKRFQALFRCLRGAAEARIDEIPCIFPASDQSHHLDGSLDYYDWNIKQGEALPFTFDNDSDEVRGDYGGFELRDL